jgi:hypothetical protein
LISSLKTLEETDMRRNRSSFAVRLAVAVLVIAGIASGSTITFATSPGSTTSDGSVNAKAVIVTGPGTLTLTLSDLLGNPTSVGQLLSSFEFSLSPSLSALASMNSFAQERRVNSDHSFTEGGTVSTGWALQAAGGGVVFICVICPNNGTPQPTTNPPPSHLIIGAGAYTNANGSIAGNGPHNPFLDESATFTISDSSITSATVVSNVMFGFGTQFGSQVTGQLSAVPETNTMMLIGAGLILLGSFRRLVKTT